MCTQYTEILFSINLFPQFKNNEMQERYEFISNLLLQLFDFGMKKTLLFLKPFNFCCFSPLLQGGLFYQYLEKNSGLNKSRHLSLQEKIFSPIVMNLCSKI